MERKQEYFQPVILSHKSITANPPKVKYPQERDWSCSLACIRTMMSGFLEEVPTEDDLINTYKLQMGPHYSKDIKSYHMLDEYEVIYGCDTENHDLDTILDYVENGYYVMLESMVNYAHWMVLLGYYPMSTNSFEDSKLLMYDPYYDEVRLLRADEFISMWRDGNYENTRIDRDYIAIKGDKNNKR